MTQNYIDTNKIKENKYKILRMSLILGSDSNREETINNFEESAREVDAMNDETYLSELEGKFYDTLKLEEEEEKLASLVDYIGGRVEQRISLLSDFANITGYDLSNLPPIKYYDKLDDLKDRLRYIREYLNNIEQINTLTIEIEEAETKLKEAYESKKNSEEINERNEEILLSRFSNIIKQVETLKDVTVDNIDATLNSIISSTEESKKSLDIFVKSYTTLKNSGINFEEEIEYKSYVDNTKEIYYSDKEQEFLLKIYKLLLNKEKGYSELIKKRQIINDILEERKIIRNELVITDNDILSSLYDILDKQYKEIKEQLNTIEDIEFLSGLIESKNNEKNEYDQANQKVEILSLLREFCIIDTYADIEEPIITSETEEINTSFKEDTMFPKYPELTIESKSQDETLFTSNNLSNDLNVDSGEITIPEDLFATKTPLIDESSELEIELTKEENVEDNQVISIDKATNLDLDLIHSKASKVMKRVGEMLGIKKDNTEIVSITSDELNQQEMPNQEVKVTPFEEKVDIRTPFLEETNHTNESQLADESPIVDNSSLPEENPLFTNDISRNDDTPADPEDDNSFWFPSDTPDALNELPDLEISRTNDTFFGDNMTNLNFPDLNLDFGPNNGEGQ